MTASSIEFNDVTAIAKANIYFEGRVVSHTLVFPDKSTKTLGLIYPGQFHFGTEKPERMEVISGSCEVQLDGSDEVNTYSAGQSFNIPGKSGFDIEVKEGIFEYVCSFLEG